MWITDTYSLFRKQEGVITKDHQLRSFSISLYIAMQISIVIYITIEKKKPTAKLSKKAPIKTAATRHIQNEIIRHPVDSSFIALLVLYVTSIIF